MIKISLKKLEKNLGLKFKKNHFVLGMDTATITGIAMIKTTKTNVEIKTQIMKIPKLPKDTIDKSKKYEETLDALLNQVIDFRNNNLKTYYRNGTLVLENSFMRFNVWTYGYLKGFMGILYALLYDYFDDIKIIFPNSARKQVGFKSQLKRGTKRKEKKQEIIDWINRALESKIDDDNIADAILLALAGLIKENK